MGYMRFDPEVVEGDKVIVTGELDRLQFEELVRLLKIGVDGLTRAGRSSGALPALPNPQPQSEQHRSTPPQASAHHSQGSSNTQQILLDKLSQGFRSQTSAAAVPSHCSPSQPGPSAAAYREIYRTDSVDHEMNAVSALAYAPMIRELPGGDGHGGWLMSASKNMVNLWECSSGAGDPALQMMHSQTTEYQAADLAVERDSLLLLAASRETSRTQAECLSLHSINALEGMFAPKGKLPLPPRSAPAAPPHHPPQHPQALQVQSLHSFGGPLRNCAAASYKQTVTVYPVDKGVNAPPKITWEAHQAFVTQLHCSSYNTDLYSAAVDGTISRWNMKAKPNGVPDATFLGLTREITGLRQISSRYLLASSAEGKLALWDVAHTHRPVRCIDTPDGHGITKLAANPEDQVAAFATAGNKMYTMSLNESRDYLRPVQVEMRGRMDPVRSLVWNSRSRCLMAAVGSSVVVFRAPNR